MGRKNGLKDYTERELVEELARRHADREFRDGMTMTDIELAAEKLKGEAGPPSIALMLSRMKPEKPTAKVCPRCGTRVPVRARDRQRTVRSLSGSIAVAMVVARERAAVPVHRARDQVGDRLHAGRQPAAALPNRSRSGPSGYCRPRRRPSSWQTEHGPQRRARAAELRYWRIVPIIVKAPCDREGSPRDAAGRAHARQGRSKTSLPSATPLASLRPA